MMHNKKNAERKAVVWIRDGVLINRMYINPVVFAFASWRHISSLRRKRPFLLEDLINFGFAKSGFSCKQKMQLFNEEKGDAIQDIEEAANDYDNIATKAAESTKFFEGIIDLLKDLKAAGVLSFITSAVSQEVLDKWEKYDEKGRLISPCLTEILGSRKGFVKGKDHFEYIVKEYKAEKIYYVADAVSEIKTGRQYSDIFNIVPIGFAHLITVDDVARGVKVVNEAMKQLYGAQSKDLDIDRSKITLPGEEELKISLREAGAEEVITEGKKGIMFNLRDYFSRANLIY